MIDVIYSGNAALKQDYTDYVQEQEYRQPRQCQEYPKLIHSRQQWCEEDIEEVGMGKQMLAGLGLILLAVCPPVGALVLLGASKCA